MTESGHSRLPPRLLAIAGSDSSGGAGLQADLKTAFAFGVYAQTVVTAVTVQDTRGVRAVHVLPPALVRGQVAVALDDIGADAVKIGMLGNGAVAAAVADALDGVGLPIVLDPVMLSSSGAMLLDAEGIEILKERLLPCATLVTPNLPETQVLTGIFPRTDEDWRNAATRFAAMGARQILFTGGHGEGETVRDLLWQGNDVRAFHSPRQNTRHTHGTGCTLATAVACGLAGGETVAAAVAAAHRYVQNAIRTAPGLGAGHGPLNHNV